MAKEFFKDLPNTTTPLTASRLNGLLDGEEAMGNIVVDSIRTKNMFDKNGITKGYTFDSSGNIFSASDYYYTPYYIEVKPSTAYIILNDNGQANYRVCEYNSSKTFIQRNMDTTTFTTSSNTYYIRVSGLNSYLATTQLELGSTATTYSPYQMLSEPLIENLTNSLVRNTTNVSSQGYLNCTRYGKVCVVSLNIQLANNIANNSTLISGLPKTYQNRVVFSGAMAGGTAIRFYIEGTEIKNDGAITTGGWIDANLTYITE